MFKEMLENTKWFLGTVSVIAASIIGGYTFITDYFVTKAYAKELETKLTTVIQQVSTQTKQNSLMITEMKLMEYEKRVERGEKLTPTETRQYNRLQQVYNVEVK